MTWSDTGEPNLAFFTLKRGESSTEMKGYSFVPSPAANLVGVAKELQQEIKPE